MSGLVRNPLDRFSHYVAHIVSMYLLQAQRLYDVLHESFVKGRKRRKEEAGTLSYSFQIKLSLKASSIQIRVSYNIVTLNLN